MIYPINVGSNFEIHNLDARLFHTSMSVAELGAVNSLSSTWSKHTSIGGRVFPPVEKSLGLALKTSYRHLVVSPRAFICLISSTNEPPRELFRR